MKIIKKEEYVLELVSGIDDERYTARWDGCVHIEHWSNGDTYKTENSEERDYLHMLKSILVNIGLIHRKQIYV